MRVIEAFEAAAAALPSAIPCQVCGSQEVVVDEVLERGVLALAECARCAFRWTWRPQRVSVVRSSRVEERRVA